MSIGTEINNFIYSTYNSAVQFYNDTEATALASSLLETAKVSKMSLGIIGGCSALGIFYAKKAKAEITMRKFDADPSQSKEKQIKIIMNIGLASIAFGFALYEIYALSRFALYEIYALSTSPALKDEL